MFYSCDQRKSHHWEEEPIKKDGLATYELKPKENWLLIVDMISGLHDTI